MERLESPGLHAGRLPEPNNPIGVAVDASGNVFIADSGDNAIKEWNASTHGVTTLVSTGLDDPNGVDVDGSGNVYIADSGNSVIKEWNAATQQVSPLINSGLSSPKGLVVDGSGNVYVAAATDDAIKELPRAFVPAARSASRPPDRRAAAGAPQYPVADGPFRPQQRPELADHRQHLQRSRPLFLHGQHRHRQPHGTPHRAGTTDCRDPGGQAHGDKPG